MKVTNENHTFRVENLESKNKTRRVLFEKKYCQSLNFFPLSISNDALSVMFQ